MRTDDEHSESFDVAQGLQVCVLSPLLFNDLRGSYTRCSGTLQRERRHSKGFGTPRGVYGRERGAIATRAKGSVGYVVRRCRRHRLGVCGGLPKMISDRRCVRRRRPHSIGKGDYAVNRHEIRHPLPHRS